jgi:hypothetical protein
MKEIEDLVEALLEDNGEDEETIKDILGGDPNEPPEPSHEEGRVERFDRWANVTIGQRQFCVSYLTPVAMYEPGKGVVITDRYWSNATWRHVVKWLNEIGMGPAGGYRRWSEVEPRYPRMPQDELLQRFKELAQHVRWSKRQASAATRVPWNKMPFCKSASDERISSSDF